MTQINSSLHNVYPSQMSSCQHASDDVNTSVTSTRRRVHLQWHGSRKRFYATISHFEKFTRISWSPLLTMASWSKHRLLRPQTTVLLWSTQKMLRSQTTVLLKSYLLQLMIWQSLCNQLDFQVEQNATY